MAHSELESIRLDKWLWAARFFKTRSLASDAIGGGKIHVNEQRVKPSKEVKIGAVLDISKEGLRWQITITALSAQRRAAKDAVLMYQEDAESLAKREQQILVLRENRALSGFTPPEHKPNKKDRRLIHSFKQG
ncbi:MAG: S4 domain-containing protein [Methylococcales bacterium]